MKKVLALILALCMVLTLFAACGTDGNKGTEDPKTSSDNNTPSDKTYKVGVALRIGDMYAAWMKEAFEAKAADYSNLEVTVFDTQDDAAKNREIIENCIQQQFNYLVIQGRLEDFSDLVKQAQDAGIGCLLINFAPDWCDGVLPVVLCSDYDLGYVIAQHAAETLPENAKVCILNGNAGVNVFEDRREGFQKGLLDARPDVTLLDEQAADCDKAKAMQKTEDWIQTYGDIDAILCASDSMAVGAVEAFKSSSKDLSKVQIYGIDGLTDACQAIINGEMTASALQNAIPYAEKSFELIQKDIAGEISLAKNECDAKTLFEAELIDSSNAQSQFDLYKEQGLVK